MPDGSNSCHSFYGCDLYVYARGNYEISPPVNFLPQTLSFAQLIPMTTVSSFTSKIYFPALLTSTHNLRISVEPVNLTVTAYLIFQGTASSLWDPVSNIKGYQTTYY